MRKSLAAVLAVAALAMGVPSLGYAQSRATTLIGQVVDAGGRGASGRTVELVSDGIVVGTTTSTYTGQFMFAVGGAGSYVVRTMVNGHPAGIRVAVRAGENPPMALLVLPSMATTSMQAGAVISSAVNAALAAGVTVTSTVVVNVASNKAEKGDDELLSSPETQAQVIAVLQDIVRQLNPNATFTPGSGSNLPPIPGLPPEISQLIQQIVNNVPSGSTPGN